MTLGGGIRLCSYALGTLGLLLGASWLLWGTWWIAGDAVSELRDDAPWEEEDPTLSGLGQAPAETPDATTVVDPEALLAAMQGKEFKEQAALLYLGGGPIPYHEGLATLLLSNLETNGYGNWAWRQALVRMRPAPIQRTFALLRAEDWKDRLEALYLLAAWRGRGDEVPALPFRDLLEDPKDKVREMAAMVAVSGIPYDPELAMWLLDQIQPGDRGPNWAPERILARMGPQGVALLLPLLDSPDAALRMQALWGLRVTRSDELRPHLGAVGVAIGDEDEDVRVAALQVLRQTQGDCEICLPAVIEALDDDSVLVVAAALVVVEVMGARAAKAVPALVALMGYEADDRIAKRATSLLGDLKAQPDRVLPALAAALHGDSADTAARALAQFGAAALPHARRVFEEGDEDARYAALLTFAELGPLARVVAPQLPALIRSDDIEMAQRALRVAGRIGPDAAVALPAVLERVWEADLIAPDRWAAEVLMNLGPGAERALREELRGKDPAKRETALRIVERCWGRSAFAFPELVPFLTSDDVETRRRAVAAICVSLSGEDGDVEVRPETDPALRARVRDLLKPFEKDPDWEIRDWVTDLLEQLEALQKG